MNGYPVTRPALMQQINRLLRGGLQVLDVNTRFRRPVVEVDRPFMAWRGREVEITEKRNGRISQVNMIRWRGIYVIWREQ
jgi:hypothetical protein